MRRPVVHQERFATDLSLKELTNTSLAANIWLYGQGLPNIITLRCVSRIPFSRTHVNRILKKRWRHLNADELPRYLQRLLVAERKCKSGVFPKYIAPRLRWRRIAAANRLLQIGGMVDCSVFKQPHQRILWVSEGRKPKIAPKWSWASIFDLVPLAKQSINSQKE